MDGGMRGSHPTDRRVVNRTDTSAAAYRQPEEPRSTAQEPSPVRTQQRVTPPAAQNSRDKKKSRLPLIVALIVFAVAVVGFGAWVFVSGNREASLGIDSSKYQTVYLMNGQIYLGKLSTLGDSKYKLTNVYYLQTAPTTTDEEGTTTDTSSQLVKLSDAIYGPEDEMIISKNQVLYFQNLSANGRGAQLIQND